MTRATRLSSFATAALLSSLAACGGRVGELEQSVDLLDTKLALDDHLVLIDKSAHHALMLEVTGAQPESTPRVVDLPRAPIAAYRRNNANEGLILCEGQRASTSEDKAPAVLTALQADGTVRKYQVGNPFDRLEQSDDGKYALLFKSGTAGRLLENPNEIAIIDLDKPAKDKNAVNLRTLTSSGDTPQSVVFSPQMTIVGKSRRLAVVLSNTSVSLIDLTNLDRQETTVQLSAAGTSSVKPAQVKFNGSGALPEVYLRGQGSSDVFVFTLTERPGGSDSMSMGQQHNDFRPSIDQLGVGGNPSDMALYGEGADARLLVLSGTSMEASVVDVSTSQVTSVQLPSLATQVLLFEGESPRDRQTAQRALLYTPGASSVMFIDLADLTQRGSRNVEQVSLDAGIASLLPLLNEKQVLVVHPDGGVSLLELQARTVAPFKTTSRLTDALFDKDRRRLWVGPQGQPYVGLLDLPTGDTPELLLDADVQQLVPLWKGGKVVAMHSGSAGYLTVIDAVTPERKTAKSVRGYLLAGLLERGL